jgi:hypothetical protein
MRRIIDGVAYDTDTATFIAQGDHDHPMSQASWSLYQTRHGAFFEVVAGHDGVVEEWNPLSDEQARRWLEANANYLIEKYFGAMPEAGDPSMRETRPAVIVGQQSPATPQRPASPGELLTLKPGIWGMSIDLKEAGRRLRQRLQQRQGKG